MSNKDFDMLDLYSVDANGNGKTLSDIEHGQISGPGKDAEKEKEQLKNDIDNTEAGKDNKVVDKGNTDEGLIGDDISEGGQINGGGETKDEAGTDTGDDFDFFEGAEGEKSGADVGEGTSTEGKGDGDVDEILDEALNILDDVKDDKGVPEETVNKIAELETKILEANSKNKVMEARLQELAQENAELKAELDYYKATYSDLGDSGDGAYNLTILVKKAKDNPKYIEIIKQKIQDIEDELGLNNNEKDNKKDVEEPENIEDVKTDNKEKDKGIDKDMLDLYGISI